MKVIFNRMEKSELARQIVKERLSDVLNKFPDLRTSQTQVTLSMENSPTQAGPDSFTVNFRSDSGRYKGLAISKSSSSLYKAIAKVSEALLERLNRFGDKQRVKNRQLARRSRRNAKTEMNEETTT